MSPLRQLEAGKRVLDVADGSLMGLDGTLAEDHINELLSG